MRVSSDFLFKKCYGKYAIAAVNVWSMEEIIALFSAAKKTDTPFIVQTTPVARNYAGRDMLPAMIDAAEKMFPGTHFSVHLDHGNRDHAMDAVKSGKYNSVMIDASHEPFEENIRITREIVEFAHTSGIAVEAELGVLSGVEDDLVVDEKFRKYTQPSQVQEFVERTGCDSLAVAVGTSHGAYKFKGDQGLQFDILEEIKLRLPGFPLVLHGGSAVNQAEISRINAAGGSLGEGAKGVSDAEIQRAVGYGVCKINIATDSRLIWARVHREFFAGSPDQFDPVIPGRTYMDDLEKFIITKFELLGAIGKGNVLK